MPKLVYFSVSIDETAIWQAVQSVAASHGYVGQRNVGNVAKLLTGIATGEISTIMLAETPRDMAINFLRQQAPSHPSLEEALTAIAAALEEARQRE